MPPCQWAVSLDASVGSSHTHRACLDGCAGAMQEAIVEQYNDQLRELREAGLADKLSDVRVTLRELRDEERAPEGGVQVVPAQGQGS